MALLAIASGASMHIWDYQTSETTRFEPHGSTPITSLAWNHNGQGEQCHKESNPELT
jgi:hypothetical protein